MSTALTVSQTLDAYVVAHPHLDNSALGRLDFWRGQLGSLALDAVTIDDVDDGMIALARRGKLRSRRGQPPEPTGEPLSPASRNRHLTSFAGLYKWARRERLLKRTHVSPTRGIERETEAVDRDRYLRAEEVDRILICARAIDRRWRKLACLVRLAFTTGLRKGSLMALRWRDVDLEAGTVTIEKTKAGRTHVAALLPDVVAMLRALPGSHDGDAFVFAGPTGRPFTFRKTWERTVAMAGKPGAGFHQLRHGCASAMAKAGVSQGTIMATLDHSTLSASSRYMHLSVNDRRDAALRVFG
jgi:integrase